MKKLRFHSFETSEDLIAEWKDIVNIYKMETDMVVKQTRLNYATIYPTNFDKQKVQLTFNVFNEKTVAVLKSNGSNATGEFVHLVTRMMNILNVKSPHTARKMNDPDRKIITHKNDERFLFLENMARMFEKMDASSSLYPGRVMCLTSQTSQALAVSLRGIVEVSKTLLKKGLKYVMTGDLNDERLEGEFGIFRGCNGGNYYMSGDQVQNALKLQRIKLFSCLEENVYLEHTEKECCKQGLSEADLSSLDNCFENTSTISMNEKSALYYICGYICQKENLQGSSTPVLDLPESEFTKLISRGKLCHPPLDLYDLAMYLYVYYSSISERTCLKKILLAFNYIYESSHCEFENISSILRRFANTFTKGFVTKETEKTKIDKKELKTNKNYSVKRRRLSNK